jgi:deoxyribodipyrimidine photolyase-related protein
MVIAIDARPGLDTMQAHRAETNTLPRGASVPKPRRFAPDAITDDVLSLVRREFSDHFGDVDLFGWAVTQSQALHALEAFIENCLPKFEDYQDAMRQGEPNGLPAAEIHAGGSQAANLG